MIYPQVFLHCHCRNFSSACLKHQQPRGQSLTCSTPDRTCLARTSSDQSRTLSSLAPFYKVLQGNKKDGSSKSFQSFHSRFPPPKNFNLTPQGSIQSRSWKNSRESKSDKLRHVSRLRLADNSRRRRIRNRCCCSPGHNGRHQPNAHFHLFICLQSTFFGL